MTRLTTTCFVLTLSLLSYVCYAQKIKVKKLEKNVYVHVSYAKMGKSMVASNGLIVKTNKGVWIIDTAWDNEQSKQIIAWVKENLNKPIKQVIVTHAHNDRVGGIQAFLDAKIPVTSTKLTAKRSVTQGFPSPQPILKKSQVIDCGNNSLEIFSPGWGHAPDNIVVYLSKQNLLFGGCFIKSTDTRKLGNIKDAHLKLWKKGLLKVQSKFKKVETVVPGHQGWGDGKLIDHTMELLDVSLHR